jgi:hypothetical protein
MIRVKSAIVATDRQKGGDATSQEDADRDGALKTRKKMAARMLELSKCAHAYINL